jgi:hypothetical protein
VNREGGGKHSVELWNNVMIKIGRILLSGRSLESGRIAEEGLQKPEGNVWHKQRTNEEGLHVQKGDKCRITNETTSDCTHRCWTVRESRAAIRDICVPDCMKKRGLFVSSVVRTQKLRRGIPFQTCWRIR